MSKHTYHSYQQENSGGQAAVKTIQGGDIHDDPPVATPDADPGTPSVEHRALNRDNLRAHAEAVARAVRHLEGELSVIGLDAGDPDRNTAEPAKPAAFDDLDADEREARVNEAALFVGNPVLAKPETGDFRPNVLWAICRALRPKLLIRRHASTPEV